MTIVLALASPTESRLNVSFLEIVPSGGGGGFISAWTRNTNFIVGNMKKNVAGQKVGAQLVSATDGSVFTGAVTVYVTGDAGAQAIGSVGAGACAHEGNGYHTYAPAQAETNYDLTAFTFIGTGAVAATVQAYNSFPQTVDLSTGITGGTITNVTTVNGLAAGVITAASIAADAITDAKVAADVTIASVTGSVGSVTGLTAANLDVAVSTRMATYTHPTGFLAATFPGTVASTTNITAGTITTVTNLTNAPTAGDLTAVMKTSVTTAADASLATTAYAEPGQGAPAATASLAAKINYLYKAWRNKATQTATDYKLFNDDALTVDQKATVSDDATTFTRNEIGTGP